MVPGYERNPARRHSRGKRGKGLMPPSSGGEQGSSWERKRASKEKYLAKSLKAKEKAFHRRGYRGKEPHVGPKADRVEVRHVESEAKVQSYANARRVRSGAGGMSKALRNFKQEEGLMPHGSGPRRFDQKRQGPRPKAKQNAQPIFDPHQALSRFKRLGELPNVSAEVMRTASETAGISSKATRKLISLLLQRAGVEPNPGPTTPPCLSLVRLLLVMAGVEPNPGPVPCQYRGQSLPVGSLNYRIIVSGGTKHRTWRCSACNVEVVRCGMHARAPVSGLHPDRGCVAEATQVHPDVAGMGLASLVTPAPSPITPSPPPSSPSPVVVEPAVPQVIQPVRSQPVPVVPKETAKPIPVPRPPPRNSNSVSDTVLFDEPLTRLNSTRVLDGRRVVEDEMVALAQSMDWPEEVEIENRRVVFDGEQRLATNRNVNMICQDFVVQHIVFTGHEENANWLAWAFVLGVVVLGLGVCYCSFDPVLSDSLPAGSTLLTLAAGLLPLLIYSLCHLFDSVSVKKHVWSCPHMVSCALSEFANGTSAEAVASSVRLKLLRLAALPVPDTMAVALLNGSELVVKHLCEGSPFFEEGGAFCTSPL